MDDTWPPPVLTDCPACALTRQRAQADIQARLALEIGMRTILRAERDRYREALRAIVNEDPHGGLQGDLARKALYP